MLPTKHRSGLSDTSNNKTAPVTPNTNKIGRARSTKSDSSTPSPLQKSRSTPRSLELKPSVERRSPKISNAIPDKPHRAPKGSEVQEDLKKVKEQLASVEQEKSLAREELKDAKRLVDEANEKVKEQLALVEQEKTRALEELKDAKRLADEANEKVKEQLASVEQEKTRALEELKDAKRLADEANEKAKEQLASVEQEKTRALEELKDARRLADEANEKLKEALAAQKGAEKISDIAKVRADELDQSHIEAARRKEEEWRKEIENIKEKDAEALLSVTQELEKVRNELEVATEAKNASISEAEDMKKIARINTEKVERLSGEINRLRSLLDSKLHGETAQMINKLNAEIDSLKYELEIAKESEDKLFIMESLVQKLSNEADKSKSAELDSIKLVDVWKKKAESLEIQLMEAKQSEKSSLESLASVREQLEESSISLQDSKLETAALREKIELLEDQLLKANQAERSSLESQVSLARELEVANASLQDAESEIALLKGKVESLEIEVADARKAEMDLGNLTDEWKKKAESLEVRLAEAEQLSLSSSDSLASAAKQLEESHSSLEEALSENAALRVKIESLKIEVAQYKEEGVGLRSEVQNLEGKLQESNNMKAVASDVDSFSEERNKLLEELEMARKEEEKAKNAMEGLESALHELSAEARETQERLFAKRLEHENAYAQIEQLRSAIRNTQENYEIMLDEARYEIVCLKKALEKFETEAKNSQDESGIESIEQPDEDANEVVKEVKVETLRLNGKLLEEESELQGLSQENDELQTREAASTNEVNELSASLAETATNKPEENGELSNSEKEYDLLPSSNEIPKGSINGSKDENPNTEDELQSKEVNGNENEYLGEEEPVEVEVKMWEGYKATDKASFDNTNEGESIDEELELKMGNGSFDYTNGFPSESTEDGAVSPTKQQQYHMKKKKKPLFTKFGNLLKKKNNN